MSRWITALLIGLLALTGCAKPQTFVVPQGSDFHGQATTDRVLVKFRSGKDLRSLGDSSLSTVRELPHLGLAVLSTKRPSSNLVRAIASNPAVEWAEPDTRFHTDLSFSDTRADEQYALQKMSLPKAWDVTLGDASVVVAVVDTGVDLTHPELKDRLTRGISFVEGTNGPMDDNGHGTHVAGIIAAEANNHQGIAGVAPKCRIMPVKVLAEDRFGRLSDIVSGIEWAVDHGARVINLSLGSDEDKNGYSRSMDAVVKYALSKNVVLVAAMGNMGVNGISYPAGYDGVIAVGATDESDDHASFSSYGKWISVSAPGVGILSTTPTYPVYETYETGLCKGYDYMDGTSMATPYVSGVAALVLSRYPNLSPSLVKSRLERTSDPVGVPGFDFFFGAGRVNAFRAIQ